MNVRDFMVPENSVQCRFCGAGDAVLTHWRCYIGETKWPDGHPRSVVIFECARCSSVRYLDLDIDLPETKASAHPYICQLVPWCILAPGHMGACRGLT